MIDKDRAKSILENYLNQNQQPPDLLVVRDGRTIDKEYGWIFFFTTSKYLETGDWQDLLFAPGWAAVTKEGIIHALPIYSGETK